MSWQAQTTEGLNTVIIASLEASLGQTIPLLPKSFLRVLARVLSGVYIILYKYGGYTFQQLFVSTASSEPTEVNGETVVPLVELGRLLGVANPAPATQAQLSVSVTVTNIDGSTLDAGTQLIGDSNGVTYLTTTAVVLNAATVAVTVRAVSDQSGGDGSGVVGNLQPGDVVKFANPLGTVRREATVAAQVVTGADGETTEAYRQRVLDRRQKRPQGGAYADYEQWAEEPAGVLNVYPYRSARPGQVDLYVESATEADGIPTSAQLEEARSYTDRDPATGRLTRRPVNSFVNAFPITRKVLDVRCVDVPLSLQATVDAAIEEYFLDREPYIEGLSVPPRRDRITIAELGGVVADVVAAEGEQFTSVALLDGATELGAYTLAVGEKAKAGTITHV